MLDLGPRARVVFAGCWVIGQAALVLSAPQREDHIFGFQMFPEASTLEIHLSRVTATGIEAAPRGEWAARDETGQLRHFSWHDRVRDGVVGTLDARVFAAYGADAQIARLKRALDDVAAHISEDADTRQLRADVRVWKNGRDAVMVTLTSSERPGPVGHL